MTLEHAEYLVREAGHKVLTSWEDETGIYACSVDSDRACLNASRFSVHFNKKTQWLTVTGQLPQSLKGTVLRHTCGERQ